MNEEEKEAIEEKNIAINKMSKDISRQLKEIEKLNFENHMLKKWNEQLDINCISKDKIRELLEEYKDTGYYEVEQVLKELLEEN